MYTSEEKKARMLLKAVIFSYHGLDEEEKQDLQLTAEKLDAKSELEWALDYIAEDHITAFDRARAYLNNLIGDYPRDKRTEFIEMVWQANNLKGYVTEMEATAMLKLARDWHVEKELMDMVLK